MNEFSALIKEVTSIAINNPSLVEITESDAEFFNSLPVSEVAPTLLEIFKTTTDPSVESRAFDALLKLKQFDKVQFLIDLFNKSSVDWRIACCRGLSRFQDPRAIVKLCDALLYDNDPDVRYVAAESLAIIGDHTAIAALEYAKAHDTGKDYEGFRVADMARQALEQIHARSSL
jgi:HEAT repeat protein